MSQLSNIEWTDATWNPVRGCTKVSPGCANCYAETFAERWRGVKGHPYEQGFDLRLVPEKLAEPLSWKKPRRVFVNSMSDLFQDGVPDEYIDQVCAVMALTPQHTYQVLTKRAERMRAYMERGPIGVFAHFDRLAYERHVLAHERDWETDALIPWPLPNVWLGVSVENQHFADQRIPLLLDTPAAVRFISAEPLLEAIDINEYLEGREEHGTPFSDPPARTVGGCIGWTPALDWVIVGGESGHGARPFNIAWARSIVAQCEAAGVPCFVKQLGAVPILDEQLWRDGDGLPTGHVRLLSARNHRRCPAGSVPIALFSRKGGNMAEWPEDLRIRQFPEMAHV